MTAIVNIYHRVPYDVYCGRPGKGHEGYFGNPCRVGHECPECGKIHDRSDETLACYETYFKRRIIQDPEFEANVRALKGKTLACFCRPAEGFAGRLMCHTQFLAAYADGIEPEDVD